MFAKKTSPRPTEKNSRPPPTPPRNYETKQKKIGFSLPLSPSSLYSNSPPSSEQYLTFAEDDMFLMVDDNNSKAKGPVRLSSRTSSSTPKSPRPAPKPPTSVPSHDQKMSSRSAPTTTTKTKKRLSELIDDLEEDFADLEEDFADLYI
jgi:hypothetical protein